ncbi:MAG: ATP-binding cassette domain-containing protein [Bacteroidota bacterium]
MNSNILELDRVVKTYQKTVAVDEVSFNIPKGSIFGLLGPNGAGKTSLIRIITTITKADSGQVLLDGERLNSSHPAHIGYMPEERGLYKKMKVGEQLTYLARLKGLSKEEAKSEIDFWFDNFQIEDWWNKKVEELSKGMQQKIQFISTVIHRPKLLILDEPFSGLDPINTNLIKDEISRLHEKGISVIFSTHRMEQVEEICERIVLINKGLNVLEGEVKEIKEQFKDNLFKIQYDGEFNPDIAANYEVVSHSNGELVVKLAPGIDSNNLLNNFIKSGVHVHAFNEILPTLNEIFIKQVEGQSDE